MKMKCNLFKKLLPSFVIFAIDNAGIDGSDEQWCTVFMIIDSAKDNTFSKR